MTGLDLTESIAPRSDQANADDFIAGPRTFTITEVRRGTAEQPFEFHLKEFPGRPYKPSKSMRRVMVAAWGADAATYVGKRLTLYTDPDVKFGGATVGGIKISEMSDLQKPLSMALTVTKGKRAMHVVKPLAAEPATQGATADQLKAVNDGLTGLGITDRDAKLATVCQVVDRELGSARELTPAEAVKVLDWIKAEQANAPATDEPAIDWSEVVKP